MATKAIRTCPLRSRVDPRLLRFNAVATVVVLAVVLLTLDSVRPFGLGLLGAQVAIFAFTGFVSFHWSLWAQLFAHVIWPRLKKVKALEDARPHRFAQLIGFVLTAAALLCFVLGADTAGYLLVATALAAALLNATTGFCLGCQVYRALRVRGT